MRKVLALFTIPLTLASTFFPVFAEEEDPPTEYIKVDIPSYSYGAYTFWIEHGYNRFYIPLDDQGNPLYNSSGISATESVDITSKQANSTYSETDSYSLSGSLSGNIRGSLYAQAVTGSGGTTNYNITTGAGAAVANLPVTGSESVSGTVTASGTIVNGNITSTGNSSIGGVTESQITYIYNIPWLEGEFDHNISFYIPGITGVRYLAFYSSKILNTTSDNLYTVNSFSQNISDLNITFLRSEIVPGKLYYYVIFFKANNSSGGTLSFDFPRITSDTKIIPLYMGYGYDLTDDERSRFQIPTNLENTIINESDQSQTLMTTGTSTSQTSENNVNSSNNTLRNKVNNLESYESTFNSNLNSSLNNITLPNVDGVVKFGNAARWVSAQFTRIANDQRINFPLIFCLSLGLALTILGRIRT